MALDADAAQKLIAQLASERDAYLANAQKTQDLLQKILAGNNDPTQPRPLPEARRRATSANVDVVSLPLRRAGSAFTGDDDTSSSDDNESLFVQTPLAAESFDMEGLREHLRTYPWSDAGRQIIRGVEKDQSLLKRGCIFPLHKGEAQLDRSHLSHYSIFDVGADGAPLEIKSAGDTDPTRSLAIWNRIKSTNADSEKQRSAVGRITIVREPSPLLFAALHYTMNKHIDMDEIFALLVDDDPALAYPHRAFDQDEKHRRSFIVTMEYFTIIGEGCQPMNWQHSDKERGFNQTHIPISRCSSAVVLAFEGPPMSRVKNRDRRVSRRFGDVYDPFSPWRVLSLQAYPDWKSSVDAHDATNHYANGPEAFLVTLRAEYNDARKRLRDVYIRVGDLVEPPPNFIFDANVRDQLLFEDESFTYSRRYFWAYQTLSIMNQDIVEMVESYRETFKDSVWDGSNKIIWPGEASQSSRYNAWRKRMQRLRRDIDYEIDKLEEVRVLNENKMKDIKALRDNLFSGTSVMESRRSVEQTAITVAQNRSIMLLTLVTIFFLPLTFVTSVFGMTNMDPNEDFRHFAWATVCICVPSYLLIGSLNTEAGLRFWRGKLHAFFSTLGYALAHTLSFIGWRPNWTTGYFEDPNQTNQTAMPVRHKRTQSMDQALQARATLDGPGNPPAINVRRQSHFDLEQRELRSIPSSVPRAGRPPPSPSLPPPPLKTEGGSITFRPLNTLSTNGSARKSVPSSPTLSPTRQHPVGLGRVSTNSRPSGVGVDTGSDAAVVMVASADGDEDATSSSADSHDVSTATNGRVSRSESLLSRVLLPASLRRGRAGRQRRDTGASTSSAPSNMGHGEP